MPLRKSALLAAGCVLAAAAPTPKVESTLESVITPLVKAHKGKVTLAIKNLETGESFRIDDDLPMPTASLIKFPVMIEAYRQAAEKRVDLDKPVTLKETDKVPGSGILTYHFSPGASFPLKDAVHLMIVYSDNTATNLVLDQIGIESTAKTMESMGLPNTKIHSKVFKRETSKFPDRSKQFGLGSATAGEMLKLCEALYKEELVSKEASKAMLEHMKACDDKDKFPRFLPSGTKLAFKTGSVDDVRTAAGIVYTPRGPAAICVMSKQNEDKRYVPDNAGNRLCAEIAKAVFDYYSSPQAR